MARRSLFSSQALVKLGLSLHETRVYQTLLEEGSLSAKEIAKRVKILPNATYRLLKKLKEKGLVSIVGKYPTLYYSLSPSVALDALVQRKALEFERLKREAIRALEQKESERETEINFIPSRYEIFMRYVEMVKRAKDEILVISIGEPIPEETLLAHRDALERGVKIRMIAHKYDKENKALLKAWQQMGLEIRHFPDWGFHLGIRDGKEAILSVNNPKDTRQRVGIQIFSQGLSKALRDYFYSLWPKATKID